MDAGKESCRGEDVKIDVLRPDVEVGTKHTGRDADVPESPRFASSDDEMWDAAAEIPRPRHPDYFM